MDQTFPQSDHDLLIVINSQMGDMRKEIKEMKDGSFARIVALEKDKADRNTVEELHVKVNNDIETRVRSLENANTLATGKGSGIKISWNVIITLITIAISVLAIIAGVKYL